MATEIGCKITRAALSRSSLLSPTPMLLAFLFGAGLALRYRVFALIPATALVIAVSLARGHSATGSSGDLLLESVLAVVPLQLGYVVAAILLWCTRCITGRHR